ncbi:ectonucleotide pyrophosphatase/phosphodiesterase, putative [Perkinsus marinus ATCC 50983]|uniref:Ectonucleotide pyrophosphatase/phosphodiesterase, putative n=1 Tax=Perkinsus marinus (strain ATCC 50983 / TXsc) TaxID=423536 RepID=C5LS34_PERM5|nr:ectonucleotide pyrophosphatase/phosphodiesterase, putative [Perkinsus marinus ATCC 50983]EER00506.1 ectonucleotide pyrophosphatase/phosphodiesterase, putative [Perkinsus marinus ATCC 50983]|eukprot:XP_002767788.1 ectonucleotide pyrophosphatase/phosphodiesterase, putative [Perkinsus marinus ATCC 50983]
MLSKVPKELLSANTPQSQDLRLRLLRGSTIVFFGTGYPAKRFIYERAHDLGVNVVLVDEPDAWCKSLVEEGKVYKFIPMNIMSPDQDRVVADTVAALSELDHVDGICTFYELALQTMARIGEELGGVHSPSEHSIMTARDNFFQEAEPIWGTTSRLGIKSVCINWVGCDKVVQGMQPTYHYPYNQSLGFHERTNKLVNIMVEDEDVRLALLYFDEPDHSGHRYGPGTEETLAAVRRVDSAIGVLRDRLHEIQASGEVNVILTSDHGMTWATNPGINLADGVDPEIVNITTTGPVTHIWPHDAHEAESIRASLEKSAAGHMVCYLRENIPYRWHYQMNDRIPPVVHVFAIIATVLGIPQSEWPPNNASIVDVSHLLKTPLLVDTEPRPYSGNLLEDYVILS